MVIRKLVVALALVAVACGKRGDPKPPVPVIPQATSDLAVTQRADKVILSWSYPSLTTTGRSLTDIRRISVYRYEEELPVAPGGRDPNSIVPGDLDTSKPEAIALFSKIPTVPQAQFLKLSTKVSSMEEANLAAATAGSRLLFTDSPRFRSVDGRPVRLTYAVVTEGAAAKSQPSNLAIIVPLPVAVPPAGLSATPKAEGVVLKWEEPKQSIAGEEGPVISGYNIFRLEPGAKPGLFTAPINSAPIKGSTYTDAPGYGEHEYTLTAVATDGPPLLQSEFSAPVRVTYTDLIPPPVPASITPLIETSSVRLLWDPVEAADLAGYRVYRTIGIGHENIREGNTEQLTREPLTDAFTADTTFLLGIAYKYAVSSVDKSGNESAKVWSDWIVVPKTP